MARLAMEFFPNNRPVLTFFGVIITCKRETRSIGLSLNEFIELVLELFDGLTPLLCDILERYELGLDEVKLPGECGDFGLLTGDGLSGLSVDGGLGFSQIIPFLSYHLVRIPEST